MAATETVNDRLASLLSVLNISAQQMAEAIGVSKQTFYDYVGGRRKKPAFEVLAKIKAAMPELDINWLIDGSGRPPTSPNLSDKAPNENSANSILHGNWEEVARQPARETKRTLGKRQESGTYQPPQSNSMTLSDRVHAFGPQQEPVIIPVVVNNENRPVIIELDARASAGLPKGLNDPEFYLNRRSFSLPGERFRTGEHFAIEVSGDSMHPTIYHGDFIVCQRIYDLDDIRDGYVHIVVTRDEVSCKRLLNRVKDRNQIVLQSDNKGYPTRSVPVDEVLGIFRAELRLSATFPNLFLEDRHRITDIEAELSTIRETLMQVQSHLNLPTSKRSANTAKTPPKPR